MANPSAISIAVLFTAPLLVFALGMSCPVEPVPVPAAPQCSMDGDRCKCDSVLSDPALCGCTQDQWGMCTCNDGSHVAPSCGWPCVVTPGSGWGCSCGVLTVPLQWCEPIVATSPVDDVIVPVPASADSTGAA